MKRAVAGCVLVAALFPAAATAGLGPVPSSVDFLVADPAAGPDGGFSLGLCDNLTLMTYVQDAAKTGTVPQGPNALVDIELSELLPGGPTPYAPAGVSIPLTNGFGQMTVVAKQAGSFNIHGAFSGDADLEPSFSDPISVVVSPLTPTLTTVPSGKVVLPPNAALKLDVVPTNPKAFSPDCPFAPVGAFQLEVNGQYLQTVAVTQDMGDVASLLWSAATPGVYTLRVHFSGDAHFSHRWTDTVEVTVASQAVTVSPESAGPHCTAGGQRIDVGLDLNGDGAATGAEVTSTQYVCNGTDGADGLNGTPGQAGAQGQAGSAGQDGADGHTALVRVENEPAGSHCSGGGKAVYTGVDANGDGTLDLATEASATVTYVCNGTNGTNGSNGTNGTAGEAGPKGSNGTSALVDVAAEAAGTNCASGGQAIRTGQDGNANGQLDADEVTRTVYVCNGAAGATGAASCNATGLQPAAWLALLALSRLHRRRAAQRQRASGRALRPGM